MFLKTLDKIQKPCDLWLGNLEMVVFLVTCGEYIVLCWHAQESSFCACGTGGGAWGKGFVVCGHYTRSVVKGDRALCGCVLVG